MVEADGKEILPNYAVHKSFGKMVVEYRHSKDHFACRDVRGNMRLVHRDNVTFTNK